MLGSTLPLFFVPFLSGVYALNDWDVACKGECSYDIPDSNVSATLQISGASHAVSDITTVGGWTVLTCDSHSLAQDIRLVCHSSDCEHLFEGFGAIDTIIRLPESCGHNPFARVAGIQVDTNQSIPARLAANIHPVGNLTRTVFILSVDTDFAAVDPAKTGPVTLSLEGYNFPVDNLNVKRRDARGLKTRNLTQFNYTNSVNLPPLVVNEDFPLLSESIDCDDFSASVTASFSTNVDATVSLGLIAVGTVIPPVISELAVYAGLDASILGTLGLEASATGSISTGKVSLYSVGIGGINFPGIFTLGPTFTIYGEIVADLDADVNLSVDLAYNVDDAKVYFPQSAQPSGGGFTPNNSALTLSVVPDVSTNGNVTAHLIPEISLGLTAFSFIKAEAYLDLDASANVNFNLDVSANATATEKSGSASGSADGCIDIGVGLSVKWAPRAPYIISGSVETALWADNWDLYNKCFASSAHTKRDNIARHALALSPSSSGLTRRADLTCPTSTSILSSIEKIIDEIIPAADLKSSSS
ncbi:hypothetical protein B0H10DRAFT_2243472 [Mycena sp. CBHHK59/15]|nr:hypothetical protein B0H10DRAFT_2243472 [Mycena sp. CBHHK59/15]